MKNMEANEIISVLNTALTAEVEAILVYTNSHTVCECPHLKLLMLETALDEMRHVKLLAEAIEEMDGKPELKPRQVRLKYAEDEELLEHAEDLEEEAIDMYTKMIKDIDDDEIKSLLTKILDEEHGHMKDIEEVEEEWAEEEDEEEDDKEDDDKKDKDKGEDKED